MNYSDFITLAEKRGWKEGNYCNLLKQLNGKQYRLHPKKIVVRLEVKLPSGTWKRITSGLLSSPLSMEFLLLESILGL